MSRCEQSPGRAFKSVRSFRSNSLLNTFTRLRTSKPNSQADQSFLFALICYSFWERVSPESGAQHRGSLAGDLRSASASVVLYTVRRAKNRLTEPFEGSSSRATKEEVVQFRLLYECSVQPSHHLRTNSHCSMGRGLTRWPFL